MRVQDGDARHYYLQEAAQEGWSVRQLECHIESLYYQRLPAAPNENKPQTTSDALLKPIDVQLFANALPHPLEVSNL